MKAVAFAKTGGPEVLEVMDLPVPKPEPDQLLVKNKYAGINFIDTYFRSGLYAAPSFPHTLGMDGIGEVVEVGANVTGFAVGDRVAYMSTKSQAEFTAVNSGTAFNLSGHESVDDKTAVAMMVQGLTAISLVADSYPAKTGEWAFVPAAAGGVGRLLVQILHAKGVKVVATASTVEKRKIALDLGATVAVGYDHDEILKVVKEVTNGEGVAVSYDGVGASTWQTSLDAVCPGGSVITFGNASGAIPPVNLLSLSGKSIKVQRPRVFTYLRTRAMFDERVAMLVELVEAGKLVFETTEYAMEDVAKAQIDMASRKTTGKLVLRIP